MPAKRNKYTDYIIIVALLAITVTRVANLTSGWRQADDLRKHHASILANVVLSESDGRLMYEFTVAGQMHHRWSRVIPAEFGPAIQSGHIEVLYVPDDPSISKPKLTFAANPWSL